MTVNEGDIAYWQPEGGGQATVLVHSVDRKNGLAIVTEPGNPEGDETEFEVSLDELQPE